MTDTVDPVEFLDYASGVAWNIMRRNALSASLFEDIEQDAHEALIKAARRFDPEKGVPFTAFAHKAIQGAVMDGIRTRTWWTRTAAIKGAQQPTYFNSNIEYESYVTKLQIEFEDDLVESIANKQRIIWLSGHSDLLTRKQRTILGYILQGTTGAEISRQLGCVESNVHHLTKDIVNRLSRHALNECHRCPSVYHKDDEAKRLHDEMLEGPAPIKKRPKGSAVCVVCNEYGIFLTSNDEVVCELHITNDDFS